MIPAFPTFTNLESLLGSELARAPKTLAQASELLAKARELHSSGAGGPVSAAKRIVELSSGRPKNFDDAVSRLNQINGLASSSAPAVAHVAPDVAQGANPYVEKVAQLHEREAARAAAIAAGQVPADIVALAAKTGVEIPKAQPSDADILAIYNALTGGQRKAFLEQNSDALWRAHKAQSRAKRARW